MAATFESFEHFKDRGLDARRRGDFESARVYLLEAARSMVELAGQASGQLRVERRRTAERLLELADDCQRSAAAPQAPRRSAAVSNHREQDESASPEDWLIRDRPSVRFEDIAGLDDAKAEIRLKMIYPVTHPDLARRYGVRAGGGVLLFGPPGCGKTMLAWAVAGELDAAFFAVSPAQILSKWVGQAEQNVRKLFQAARAEPAAVIFIDEIEALVPRRAEQQSAVMTRVVPQILLEMEGIAGRAKNPLLFLAATNEPAALDPAVLRPGRFDEKVYIPLPDAPARYRMLEIYLGERPLADDVDLGRLCDMLAGCSGADIRRICERAATIPFLEAVANSSSGEAAISRSADAKPPRPIAWADIETVLAESRPSVYPSDLARYESFAAQ